MKAWLVREKGEFGATVVFAETRGKAKSYALKTEDFQHADYCELETSRVKQMDRYYVEGKKKMDWLDSKDRIVLVKDCGFVCDYDYFGLEDCEMCPAKEYCDRYKEYLTEKGDVKE